ncbi:hypothetical protein [Gordonia sp. (in: high G+C Gram-positive bacteria)]|uniref:hypothetical protein n=1 Tax=Gordonia sp. (in: high G+C Gram-positive bacteria) TaxID=84139 RepID=UPI0016A77906|nr:hypothetical protein [Gordonia sp. (in: high G+C Gram-positive bacteria)]NLG46068.1 hypothetical protein [Gordonia sp. (in: high G+C Gram-positive bacteria)]
MAASAALVVGAAPAHAAGAAGPPPLTCAAGEVVVPSTTVDSVECRDASPAILAKIGDALIPLILPDAGINLSALNSATAISLSPWFGDMFPGSATIAGTGLASATAVGGTANATADAFLSGAISVGSLGATADSYGLGGLGLSIGAGLAQTSARALPGGIAVALGMGENASATALGGVAVATGFLKASINGPDPDKSSVVCTALYGTAEVTDGETGKHYASCTSVAFIFQKSQQGDGPVVYAIKNPFSLAFGSPLAPLNELLDTVSALGIEAPFPTAVTDILTGKVIPMFTSDLIRVTMTDDGPKFGTDLFGKKSTTPAPDADQPPAGQQVADVQRAAVPAASEPAASEVVTPVVEDDAPIEEAPVTSAPAALDDTTAADVIPAAPTDSAPTDSVEAPEVDDSQAASEGDGDAVEPVDAAPAVVDEVPAG